MKVEILTPEEWSTPDGIKPPAGSILIGVKDEEGQILARSGIVNLPHIEGTWVTPLRRKSSLGFKMIRTLEHVARRLGKTHIFAFAHDTQPEVSDYLKRLGYEKQPLTVWVKKVGE